jgi:hypothetical protein
MSLQQIEASQREDSAFQVDKKLVNEDTFLRKRRLSTVLLQEKDLAQNLREVYVLAVLTLLTV